MGGAIARVLVDVCLPGSESVVTKMKVEQGVYIDFVCLIDCVIAFALWLIKK